MKKDLLYLKKLFSEPFRAARAGGQTNRNYVVRFRGKQVFVRLPWERSDVVDRNAEGANIKALADNGVTAGITPRFSVYVIGGKNILKPKEKKRYEVPDGTMVTEYIEGRELDGRVLENRSVQQALVTTLHAFHTSGVRFVNRYDVFSDEVEKYRKLAKRYPLRELFSAKEQKEILAAERMAKKGLDLARRGVSAHNDLIFENLLLGRNGKLYLIDFEYGGLNVREGIHYDWGVLGANLFYRHPLSPRTFQELLTMAQTMYPQALSREKIMYGSLANILVMLWWGAIKYFSSTTKKDKRYFRKYVLDRAKGLKLVRALIAP